MNRTVIARLLAGFLLSVILAPACRGQQLPPGLPEATATSGPTVAVATPMPRPTRTPSPTPVPAVVPATLEVWADESTPLGSFRTGTPFRLYFNQAMVPTGSQAPLRVTPFLRGDIVWDESHTTLTFAPTGGFRPGASYTMWLDRNLISASGLPVDPSQRWRVYTLSAPVVTSRNPNSAQIAERQPTIRLNFSHEMDRASVVAALSVEPAVALETVWQGNALYVSMAEPLDFGTRYQFALNRTAADAHGVGLSNVYQWGYELAAAVASVRATPAGEGASVVIRFNYPMNQASVRRAMTFAPPISGQVSWDEGGMELTLAPADRLPGNAEYAVSFSGPLLDASGAELPQPAPLSFVSPPPILSSQPPRDSTVHPATTIEIRFDRPMDESRTAAAFSVTPAVTGTLEWEETTLVFRPEENVLRPSTSYMVTIGSDAADDAGELVLNRPYSWGFETGELVDIASFGWGPNAQLVDADGRRAVQFQAYRAQAAAVTFELYRLGLTQFLDRYSSGFRGVAGYEERPISTAGTTLVASWSANSGASGGYDNSIRELVIPADVAPGLYILNLTAGYVNDQLLLILSANSVAVKQAEGEIVAWVSDINGAALPGSEVSVYARDGRLVARGAADDMGVFRTAVPIDPEPLIVVARVGDDLTAAGLTGEWRSSGSSYFNWWQPRPAAPDYAAFIHTDRPIYRPGHTVYFRSLVRYDDDALLSVLPAGTPVTVRLRDARDNVVLTQELLANDFGTVHGQFQVAEGAMVGNYAIEISLAGDINHRAATFRQIFKVQDYRKPDYQVTVSAEADNYVDGDAIAVTVDSSYFFGEPVPNAAVVVQRYNLRPRYWWEGVEPGGRGEEYVWYQDYSPAIHGRTDESGRLTFTLAAEGSESGDSYGYYGEWGSSLRRITWGIEATVDDGSHQSVSGFAVVNIYNSAEQVSLRLDDYFQEPGTPFAVQAVVSDVEGRPAGGRSLRLELRRYNRSSDRYETVVQQRTLTTDANGLAAISFTAQQPGYYQLRISGTDRLGHAVHDSTGVYVFREGDWAGWDSDDGGLSISADRPSYAPGDTAQLLVRSNFSGPALLTVERGTVRRQLLIELTTPATTIPFPILADDRPNIFVTVNAWEAQDTSLREDIWESLADSRLHVASVQLSVPVTDKSLNIEITTDQDSYAPRDNATFSVRVTNGQGIPVSAEVSLAIVDEAIFALSDELSGPLFDAFYYARPNIVSTFDALALRRYLGGGMGGGGGGDGGSLGSPRSDFEDTAAWFPALYTDASGRVTVTLTLPDNLTSWRLTARAITADTQVGERFTNVRVSQEIVVRPILPRTLTAGDEVQISVLVHNYGQSRQELSVAIAEAESEQLEFRAALTQTISLAPGEVRVVGWPLTALAAGEAQILVSAMADGRVADAVQLPLAIRPLAVPDVTTQIGQFSGELATEIVRPAGALEMSTVRIELSRSIAGSLLEGLEYLTGFPYGCVEQTMSKALPNAVVGRALGQLGVTNPTLQADLPPRIQASIQRLYGFQHNDGGWGWWYDDSSHDYQTAWVIFGLAVTAEAGYEIDPGVIERGVGWLRDNYGRMDPRTGAFALYSMAIAGHPYEGAAQALLGRPSRLDTFSRAALALALFEEGDTAAARGVVDTLAERATVTADGRVYWSGAGEDGYFYQKTMASAVRNTAIALSAFTRVRPESELIMGMVRYLMAERRTQGWGTTNETAFTIIALTDHLLATSFAEGATETGYAVELNGQVVASGSLGRGEPAVSLELAASELRNGTNSLRITQSGSGRLYYVISNKVYVAQESVEAGGPIEISRVYLDAETGRRITTAQAGELVKVQITVVMPGRGSYMIVEDSLPGGLEALNEGLNTTSHVASAYEEPRYYWQELGYNHKEVRGDRVSFFITDMAGGRHTFSYYARATHSGEFVAMPVEAYAMYDLAAWGRSASSTLSVAE